MSLVMFTKLKDIKQNKATATFGVDGSNETFTRITKVVGGKSNIDSDNQVTWTDLNPGSQLNINVTALIGIISTITSTDPDTGLPTQITITTPKTVTESFSIYTQPAKFSWEGKGENGLLKGGSDGDIVNDSDFMNKWNNLCNAAGQYQAWLNQTDQYYGNYKNYKYEKDQWMSASKFNGLAKALKAKTDNNENLEVKKDDIITAKLFNDLIQNVE